MGRQVITTVDRVAAAARKFQSCTSPRVISFKMPAKDLQTDRTFPFQVDGIEALRVGGAFAEINQFGSCFGNRKSERISSFNGMGRIFPVDGFKTYKRTQSLSSPCSRSVYHLCSKRSLNRWIKIFGDRICLFACRIVKEELPVGHIGSLPPVLSSALFY